MTDSSEFKRELLSRVGDPSQLFGIRDMTINSGKGKGVRVLDVNNGGGLVFSCLPDRGLDLAGLSWHGVNLSYIAKAGIVAPQYFTEEGHRFLGSFTAGFLTTCGLRNVGPACEDGGEHFGLHGSIANIPADEVTAVTDWSDQLPEIRISGSMRDARLFGPNLVLRREITSQYGSNKLKICDQVENQGFSEQPLMILYHFNLGYPLLNDKAQLVAPIAKTAPRDDWAGENIACLKQCQKPTAGYREMVFDHDLHAASDGMTCAGLVNDELNLGVAIRYNKRQLHNLTHWKMMGQGDYVIGIEPCNCRGGGREEHRRTGQLEMIQPGKTREFSIEVEFLSGPENLKKFKMEADQLDKG